MNDNVKKRLEQDLGLAVSRLQGMSGAVAVGEAPGPIGDHIDFVVDGDVIQANESREIGFATRELLVERVQRLSAALDRLDRGEYGTCAECDEPISPARLRALPEVQTCFSCQARRERGALYRSRRRAARPLIPA